MLLFNAHYVDQLPLLSTLPRLPLKTEWSPSRLFPLRFQLPVVTLPSVVRDPPDFCTAVEWTSFCVHACVWNRLDQADAFPIGNGRFSFC